MHMFKVVSYFVVVPHLFATISFLSADNCFFYIIPLKNRCYALNLISKFSFLFQMNASQQKKDTITIMENGKLNA